MTCLTDLMRLSLRGRARRPAEPHTESFARLTGDGSPHLFSLSHSGGARRPAKPHTESFARLTGDGPPHLSSLSHAGGARRPAKPHTESFARLTGDGSPHLFSLSHSGGARRPAKPHTESFARLTGDGPPHLSSLSHAGGARRPAKPHTESFARLTGDGSPYLLSRTHLDRALVFLIIAVALTGRAERVLERTFSTSADYDACTRDTAIDATSQTGAVRLVDEAFIIHATGDKLYGTVPKTGTGRKLAFSAGLLGKKIFPLEDARSRGATLSIFGGAGQALFNGHPLTFTQLQHQAGWSFVSIPPEWLKSGDNEVALTNGFRMPQDRETDSPRFSLVSRDGGVAWEPAAGGEFLISLRLRRHPRSGVITSPVIDLANPADATVIAPLAAIGEVAVTHQAYTPDGTVIALETRAGNSPLPDRRWSSWRGGAPDADVGRYLQWRATLRTDNPLVTPVLSNVTVAVRLAETASAESRGLQLVGLDDHPLRLSSYLYDLQRPSRKLKKLREQYRLDEVVAAGRTDFEKLLLLRNWVRRQWRGNDGFGGRWDALEILAAPPGKKGMCVHYGNLFSQCALALGYCARPVIINGHFIADVWSPDPGKWVAMDVEAIYPPIRFERFASAHYVDAKTRAPLSILEVYCAYHRALDAGAPALNDIFQVFTYDDDDAQAVPHDMLRPTPELRTFARFAYPPRNDHLDREEPWEEYHGQDHYHSNGYLWWRGRGEHAQSPQYSWTSDRPGDFEWTLDQVSLGLTAGRKTDRLAVTARTFTPNFDEFRYSIDSGKWQTLGGRSGDPDLEWSELDWQLHDGVNVLEIKPVNRFGREGAVSRAEVRRET